MTMQIFTKTTAATVAALALAAGALPGVATAADFGRGGSIKDDPVEQVSPAKFYFAVRGGFTFPDDTDFDINLGGVRSVTNEYDTGYFVGGALGVTGLLGIRGLRGDIEIGYSDAEIESHNVGGIGKFSGGDAFGSTDIFYGIASIYYDFDTGTIVKPFIGAGGGIAEVNFDGHGVNAAGVVLDDSSTAYAYHITAGLNFQLAANLNLELGYRYFGTTGAELTAVDGTTTEIDTAEWIGSGQHLVRRQSRSDARRGAPRRPVPR
ncbi:MAG: porin family protein [Rhodospirillales bacterium]|nr:porin family protein [Rhodospirillales bacterium]